MASSWYDYFFGGPTPANASPRQQYLSDHEAYLAQQRQKMAAQNAPPPAVMTAGDVQRFMSQTGPQFAADNSRNGLPMDPTAPPVDDTPQQQPAEPPPMTASQLISQAAPSRPSPMLMAGPVAPTYQQPTDRTAGAQQRDMMQTGPTWAADNAMRMPVTEAQQKQADEQTADTSFPKNADDWTWWDHARAIFSTSDEGADAYWKARNPPVQGPQQQFAALPDQGPVPMDRPGTDDGAPDNMPTANGTVPGGHTPVQLEDPIQAIQRQKAMIDAIYPQAPSQMIGEDKLDAEMDKDKQRANYLAQLAFFSGITQGAGGSWEGVGKGLAGAGAAYTGGFDRYQKALTAKVNRQQNAANVKYREDTARADAAVKLYGDEQTRDLKAQQQYRTAAKDNQTAIDKFFTEALKSAKGNDMEPSNQDKINELLKNWQISRQRGEIVSDNTDVSDQ